MASNIDLSQQSQDMHGVAAAQNRLCVGRWLDAEPQTGIAATHSLKRRGQLARSNRWPTPPRHRQANH
jgi:hypothetical protein